MTGLALWTAFNDSTTKALTVFPSRRFVVHSCSSKEAWLTGRRFAGALQYIRISPLFLVFKLAREKKRVLGYVEHKKCQKHLCIITGLPYYCFHICLSGQSNHDTRSPTPYEPLSTCLLMTSDSETISKENSETGRCKINFSWRCTLRPFTVFHSSEPSSALKST